MQHQKKILILSIVFFLLMLILPNGVFAKSEPAVQKLADGFRFTEGPALDKQGNLFFTDIPNKRIHRWSTDGILSTFMENSGGANGLYFDKKGNLLACQGTTGKVVSIDAEGKVTVLADSYQGKALNSPNDLWLDSKGGIYFTDPRYGRRDNLPQDGEHVYYLSADRKQVIRVIDDMVRPNGVIGTPDGKRLYVADQAGNKTYAYTINPDGTLSGKTLFADQGSDGMTLDSAGNVYLTGKAVTVYTPAGKLIRTIDIPETPSNVIFDGKNRLYITARKAVYTMNLKQTFHSFTVDDIDGNPVDLSDYQGKVVLVVNVASKCGFTKQYAGLEQLYQTYKDKGFVILGFPANNFGSQEPGTDAEIKTFCTRKFNVTFPMFSKISAKGDDIHPLYAYLTSPEENGKFGKPIKWNFNKFLIDQDGNTLAYFPSKVAPMDAELVEALEKALGK
jgi:gluconolactonase